MNPHFPRLIVLLRKEKGLSQKDAAKALEISQALLSHYEKGIRECGLDFLVKIADFYGVTTDYLLGRSASRDFAVSCEAEKNEDDDKNFKGSVYATMHKKLLISAISLLFDLLQSPALKEFANYAGMYISTALYKVFRFLYFANKSNPQGFFAVKDEQFPEIASCDMLMCEMNMRNLNIENPPEISYDGLKAQNPFAANSLFNIVRNVEMRLQNNGYGQ